MPFPSSRPAALAALMFALPSLPLHAGCASRGNRVDIAAGLRQAAVAPHTDGADEIQRSPAYHQAVIAFSAKDFRGALDRIDSLLKASGLSPAARAFLQHQRVLCQDAMAGRSAATTAVPHTSAGATLLRHSHSASDADCGLRALMLVCEDLKVPANLGSLRKAAGTTADGTTLEGLARATKSVGLQAEGVQMDRNALSNLQNPAVFWLDGNHFVAVLRIHHSLIDPVNGDTATVHDANKLREEEMPLDGPTGLLSRGGGMLLLLSLSRENESTGHKIASVAVPTH